MTAAQPDVAGCSVGRAVRVLAGVLATALVVVVTAMETPARASHYEGRACPHHVTQGIEARERYMRCEEERIDPPGTIGYILGIARCESGPDLQDTYVDDPRTAADEGDEHGGPLQQAKQYWLERFRTYTGPEFPRDGQLRNNPGAFRSNVLVSFRQARAVGTWARDWTCA